MQASDSTRTLDLDAVRRVLVVDDEEIIGRTLRRAPVFQSAEVRCAFSVNDALTALQWQPQLILLDVMLPDGSGLDVGLAAAAVRPLPLIIVMSGACSRDEAFRLGRKAGAGYLEKPFGFVELEAAIRRALADPVDPRLFGAESARAGLGLVDTRQLVVDSMIVQACAQNEGNITHAAAQLQVSPTAVRKHRRAGQDA